MQFNQFVKQFIGIIPEDCYEIAGKEVNSYIFLAFDAINSYLRDTLKNYKKGMLKDLLASSKESMTDCQTLNIKTEEIAKRAKKGNFLFNDELDDLIKDFSAFLTAKNWPGYRYDPKLEFEEEPKVEPVMEDAYLIEKIITWDKVKETKIRKAKERIMNYKDSLIVTKSLGV